MAFVRTDFGAAHYASPGEMYRDLPRRPGAVPGLWAHQSEMLRAYTPKAGQPDIALELPTGTGKTLTGLLIAEWTRRQRSARVIYACTTKQLARQVAASARREGIDTALLIGRATDWSDAAHAAYESASAVAITTYSSIFNSHPYFASADLILFDDAHAGEQYVGEAYGVNLSRWNDADEYAQVLRAVAPALDGVFLERLRADEPDPSVQSDVRLVVPLRQANMVQQLDASLAGFDAPHRFRYSMIRAGLASCLVYVAYSGILVRPYLPPTHNNRLFTDARQRLYLSATLGEGGELERAFGRSGIERLAQPDESSAPRYGRRFFVFPDFVEDADTNEIGRAVVKAAGKALVLAPRTATALADATALAPSGWPVWGTAEITNGLDSFAELEHGICALAARYDGLDLPGDTCRLVVLDEVPDQDSLQERFLQTRARAGAALAARVRTRVVQGAGRCTRGPGDTAIVIIKGAGLSRYLTRPEVIAALDPELQAEVRFGRENSQAATATNVLENVRVFLDQESDDTWRGTAEPILTDYRREMRQEMPRGTTALAVSTESEIRAWAAATVGAWYDAAQAAYKVQEGLANGGWATEGYRVFWMYLEAVWSDEAAAQQGDSAGQAAARALVRRAEEQMGLGSWVRQMAPLPSMQRSALSAVDNVAVSTIAGALLTTPDTAAQERELAAMHTGLSARDPKVYEPALTTLGVFVGAEAWKPTPHGRCDSVWVWGNELWLALEAKSNHEPTGVVPHRDVRQANDQLRLIAADRGVPAPPPNSATVLISPKPGVHSDGINGAEPHVHLVSPAAVLELADDVESAWRDVLARRSGRSEVALRELAASAFFERGALPSQIAERLTRDPVATISEER